MSENALALITGLVVTVTGFQLYKDANEFYFSQDCRRCDGAGKMTCSKCRGYGYLKKAHSNPHSVKAFRQQEDVANIYLCPFCKGTGTGDCQQCRGKAKTWPATVNVTRLFKWRHVHQTAAERHNEQAKTGVNVGREEAKRKTAAGLGGFSMAANANLLPYERAAQAQEQQDK